MKSLIIFLMALLSFAGCSTTHYLKYYKSSKQFYEHYNRFAGKTDIEVVLSSDSVMYFDNHSVIRNDTLYYFKTESEEKKYNLPSSGIRSIHYNAYKQKKADIILDNGLKLKAGSIVVSADSISFIGTREWLGKIPLVPVDELKVVSYKNHWRAAVTGALAGILLGGIVGTTGWVFHPMDGGMTEQFDQASATFIGAFTGLLIGPVVGYFIGWNINYQFSP
jgi:hypothetical protein